MQIGRQCATEVYTEVHIAVLTCCTLVELRNKVSS